MFKNAKLFSTAVLFTTIFAGSVQSAETVTVDNFVRRLRAKLERDPKRPRHLVTVHGMGYRFDP